MSALCKNRHLFTPFMIVFLMLGCNDKMTYQAFLKHFQAQCPDYYLIKDLTHQSATDVCNCMQQNYPDMASLVAGISAHDREPRGETDYVPSAISMAAASCIDK